MVHVHRAIARSAGKAKAAARLSATEASLHVMRWVQEVGGNQWSAVPYGNVLRRVFSGDFAPQWIVEEVRRHLNVPLRHAILNRVRNHVKHKLENGT